MTARGIWKEGDTEDRKFHPAPFGLPWCLARDQEGFTSWLLPVPISVAHAIRDNTLALLATVQYDLDTLTAMTLGS